MDHDTLQYLRGNSAAWRLLRADNAPLVLAVLGQLFIVENVRTIAETDLMARVDDMLYAINSVSGGGDKPPYPRPARDYVEGWASPEHGWLRKFYPDGEAEAHYDATVEVEKAHTFVTGLATRSFIGTQSRLTTIVELLRDIVAGGDRDPGAHVAALRRRRDEIDAQIALAEAGESIGPDAVTLLDKYQHFAGTARELLGDFRAVEENFRALDRSIRADIASWDGSKGELLDQIVGERHAIADSDQGRSFQAFHDYLLSRVRREELTELLERLHDVGAIEVDRGIEHIHFDWLNAAERTQATVRLLSEQLRRFLDDKVWLENRRVVELLRSIERSALSLRDVQAPDLVMHIDGGAPAVSLPFERPLYAPNTFAGVDSVPSDEGDGELDLESLFDQVYVDTGRLADSVRACLRSREQISLDQLLGDHPPTQGIAELVAYLGLTEDDFDVAIDEGQSREIVVEDSVGTMRTVQMPLVMLVRNRTNASPIANSGGGERT